jgi:hypothetical protein
MAFWVVVVTLTPPTLAAIAHHAGWIHLTPRHRKGDW